MSIGCDIVECSFCERIGRGGIEGIEAMVTVEEGCSISRAGEWRILDSAGSDSISQLANLCLLVSHAHMRVLG